MHLLLSLASMLGLEVSDLLDRIKKNVAAWSAVALFSVICLVYLLVALHAALVDQIGPLWAPLVIAAAALAVALGIVTYIKMTGAVARKRATERRHDTERATLLTTAAAAAVPMVLKSPVLRIVALPVAAAAAYFFLRPGRHRSGDRDDNRS